MSKNLIEKYLAEDSPEDFDRVLKIFKSIKLPPGYTLVPNIGVEVNTIDIRTDKGSDVVTYVPFIRPEATISFGTAINIHVPSKDIPIDSNFKSRIEKFLFGVFELSKINTTEMLKELFNSIK